MNARVWIVNLASLAAVAALLAGLIAAILTFSGNLEFSAYLRVLNLASLVWFLAAPLWFVPRLFGPAFAAAAEKAWLRPKPKK